MSAIARDLSTAFDARPRKPGDARQFSLAGGDAGIATFFHGLAARPEFPDAASMRDAYLGRAVAALSDVPMDSSLYGGFCGIAWAIDRISTASGGATLVEPGALDSIDRVLADYVERRPDCDLDVVSGAIGIGVYLLDRLPRAEARRGLTAIVESISERAERSGAHVTWRTPSSRLHGDDCATYPEGRYDLGVAHGVPGVIAFLSQCVRASIATDTARELLAGAVTWLLDAAAPRSAGFRFPCWIAPVGPAQPTRLAWCYGDLGVSLALLQAADATSRAGWRAIALELASDAARRTSENSGVIDAGLCHGTACAAHLFRHWFRATSDARFLDASRYWYRQTLSLRGEGLGIGGYRSVIRDVDLNDVWIDDPELLNGAAGIGLSLLGAATDGDTDWDRFLLLPPSADRFAGERP